MNLNWWLIFTIIEFVVIIVLSGALLAIRKRAKALGLPVGFGKKEGVVAILLGKVAKLQFAPLKAGNFVELEVGGKKGIWKIDDIGAKPIPDLYGISAAVLHVDSVQTLDTEVLGELEGLSDEQVELVKEYFKLLREESKWRSKLLHARKSENKMLEQHALEELKRIEGLKKAIEKDLKIMPSIMKIKKPLIVPSDDGGVWLIRSINVDVLKRFARALPAPALYSGVIQYMQELKSDKTDYLKVAFAIVLVLIGVGVLLALKQQPINYEQLAKVLHHAAQSVPQNTTKVVVS